MSENCLSSSCIWSPSTQGLNIRLPFHASVQPCLQELSPNLFSFFSEQKRSVLTGKKIGASNKKPVLVQRPVLVCESRGRFSALAKLLPEECDPVHELLQEETKKVVVKQLSLRTDTPESGVHQKISDCVRLCRTSSSENQELTRDIAFVVSRLLPLV
ncbi:hypothetical protein SJAG_04057 [Schizosaccharomyces japonicus yFS275]|uniref:Uncharacterized protein n=1 Tax=Schizosaccharomyces japonicus (strain yFS275 / FY16936) TaxID=402676 RepID=B6K5T1_SCHJY|nr:hypothetical protein SJAG_04057 [Schizosaccharomyces japonicus yFS275]EEB08885.1 hypothetical protein SJAG_04057 [Schizosaccharomyces japonicus yFS275]